MSIKVKIDDTSGFNQIGGQTGVQIDSAITFASTPVVTISPITSNTTLVAGGVYTISGASAVTVTMPLAATVPGSLFVFRNASATAHVLTGSQEDPGTLVFAGAAGTGNNAGHGSKSTFQAILGNAAAYICDGKSFLQTAVSGTMTFSGT